MPKPSKNLLEQIAFLQSRGMKFRDDSKASHFLSNISYYRLKGYWWEMQSDYVQHAFKDNSYFE